MKTRILSACIMLPLLILVYLGGWFLEAAVILCSFIGLNEFYKGFKAKGAKPSYVVGYGSIVLLYLINLLGQTKVTDGIPWNFICFWFAAVVIASMIYGFKVNERQLEDMTSTVMGIFYVVFLMYFMIAIDQTEYAKYIWLVFLASFGTDTMAYFVGMAIGKHKLCPNLSPKKSVEGAIGGVLGSIVFCGIFAMIVFKGNLNDLVVSAIVAVVGSVISQLGDLSASAFKRQMGIKDYGNLIPGHGGILDRFDSVLFCAPVTYLVAVLVNTFLA